MTDDEIWSAVVQWIAGITGVPTIRSRAGGPEPAARYIAVNFLGSIAVRDHEQTITYTDALVALPGDDFPLVTAAPIIETEWRFSVHGYGSDASSLLNPIKSAARITQASEPLEPEFALFVEGDVKVLPEIINAVWQDRAQLDVFVRGITDDGFVVDVIDAIPITINGVATTVQVDEG